MYYIRKINIHFMKGVLTILFFLPFYLFSQTKIDYNNFNVDTATKVFTKVFRSSQFVVWGVSDTKVDTKVETFAALNVAFAAPNVAMTSVSLLSLLTMPCLTSSYLRSVSSCRAMSGVSSDRPAAKHDASGNATALSGSAPILWNLWAVA